MSKIPKLKGIRGRPTIEFRHSAIGTIIKFLKSQFLQGPVVNSIFLYLPINQFYKIVSITVRHQFNLEVFQTDSLEDKNRSKDLQNSEPYTSTLTTRYHI